MEDRESRDDVYFSFVHHVLRFSAFLNRELGLVSKRFKLRETEARYLILIGSRSSCTSWVPIQDLTCFFAKHKSTIRQKLRWLEERGYVEFQKGKRDQRRKFVRLTESGCKLFHRLKREKEGVRRRLFQELRLKELKECIHVFEKLYVRSQQESCGEHLEQGMET